MQSSKGSPRDPFEDAHLFISLRSPFARRVRLAFLEHGVPFHEEAVDLFGPDEAISPALLAANPLIRVPTLRLAGGEVIIDSHEILSVFYSQRESAWMPRDPAGRIRLAFWSGLAVGMFELTIDHFFEMRRPEANRDPERLAEIDRLIHRSLTTAEKEMSKRQEHSPQALTQADLDLGTALAYLAIRYPGNWQAGYPACVAYMNGMNTRPSFVRTAPPPPGI